ncbi:MAG: transcription-repair coupling factor, partial [Snowella sp.]
MLQKLQQQGKLSLSEISRLPKGLIASTLAQSQQQNLWVICATLEEAGRWSAQLEAMGWETVHFYPTSEASPYEQFNPESEMIWGQMQVLSSINSDFSSITGKETQKNWAIVTTEKAMQLHLPPPEVFQSYCLNLQPGVVREAKKIDETLARLGYKRVPLVETEGQWSRRGDIVDIFPVSAELPVRLEWFGDELERLREFDPATQRSLDKIEQLILTPTSFAPMILQEIETLDIDLSNYLNTEGNEATETVNYRQGVQRFLG